MIEPISAGICIWLAARWMRRKMDEVDAPTADTSALMALCKKHGIQHEDAHGVVRAYDLEYEQAQVRSTKGSAPTFVDARHQSIHLHFHHHFGQGAED